MSKTSNYPGEFYFDLTEDGSLKGEFTHRGATGFGKETGIRKEGDPAEFAGNYDVVWLEPDGGDREEAQLVISTERAEEPTRYALKWTEEVGSRTKALFTGHGFVRDGRLFGSFYSDQE